MYDSFDLFFYPTLEEGSSLPLINAQCRGLTAIIYKGNKLDPEVTKYCIVSKDVNDAAKIIKRIKGKGIDKHRKQQLTNYARSFSWDRTTKETLEIYKGTLKHHR
jgi:glycosyltransferase involved in cell wall biosynthesis